MKLANRFIERLFQEGLVFLWEKYQLLPTHITSTDEFRDQLKQLVSDSVATTLDPQSREFGILVSDLRGFTPMSERYPPLAVVELLNHYYCTMVRVIDAHGGVIDKFMGDSVMAIFDSKGNPQAARKLLHCVIDMQLAMDEVNAFAETLGLPDIYMGIGINYGSMIACELGSDIYRELTVLGNEVNLASRLTAYCLRGQVLMSGCMYKLLEHEVVPGRVNEIHVKGKSQSITIHEILGTRTPAEKLLPVRDSRKTYRVEVDFPVSYFVIEDKHVSQVPVTGRMVDLSRYGMKILSRQPLAFPDELKVVTPFLALGRSSEIYAKVLACKPEGDGQFGISVEFTYLDEPTSKAIKVFVDHLI
jgi:adenylate cyclase